MALSRLTAAIAAIRNENSIGYPGRISESGSCHVKRRKTDAKEGSLHRTARRLGALFKDVLPSTDELFRAYGTRVSEIASAFDSSSGHISGTGYIFASYAGADSTSIWAAATSGSAAIAAQLLACMLARMFTGTEATSIWVELVQTHKERIRRKSKDEMFPQEHNMAEEAAQQDITRIDLSNWDASVRAWLESADHVKLKQHKQTMLILNSACVPVNKDPDTYSSVIKAWTTALTVVNELVNGMPQRIQKWSCTTCSLVLALISRYDGLWRKLCGAALLTLGLQEVRNIKDSAQSVYWSLPLARLQYYGTPVQATRSIGQEISRVPSQNFAYIALGCVFQGWNEYAATNEHGLLWMENLANILGLEHLKECGMMWLHNLVVAARRISESGEMEKKTAMQLINLGKRRSVFLHRVGRTPPPLFGLSELETLLGLLSDPEKRIECLRRLSSGFGVRNKKVLIMCQLPLTSQEDFSPHQSATTNPFEEPSKSPIMLDELDELNKYAKPEINGSLEYASFARIQNSRSATKRDRDGKIKNEAQLPGKFYRWITLNSEQLKLKYDIDGIELLVRKQKQEKMESDSQELGQEIHGICDFEEDLEQFVVYKDALRLKYAEIKELEILKPLSERWNAISALEEICLPVFEYNDYTKFTPHTGPRLVFSREPDFVGSVKELLRKASENISLIPQSVPRSLLAGNENVAALVSIDTNYQKMIEKDIAAHNIFEEFFVSENIDKNSLYKYFLSASDFVQSEISSLRGCAMMANVYRYSPGATVSALVVKQPIYHAKWFLSAKKVAENTELQTHIFNTSEKNFHGPKCLPV
ncbi:hypothetical protein BPOR_1064g00020 [Botrytis porri]|uniref:Uncharacterized protein n=1 Tax=Botrytis porri TaxID=87229 RepID=A0A4Z1K6C7_9HELO|nr:hypothetical protein BPOR_1064g00020 [Botrytis porri]